VEGDAGALLLSTTRLLFLNLTIGLIYGMYILSNRTGSGKSNMAAAKSEVLIGQLETLTLAFAPYK